MEWNYVDDKEWKSWSDNCKFYGNKCIYIVYLDNSK